MLQAPVNLGCGCGIGCACGNGLGCACNKGIGDGNAPVDPYADFVPQNRTQGVLWDYIQEMQAAGKPWYITAALNSDTYGMNVPPDSGMGFFAAIFAAIAAVASTVGHVVAAAAPTAIKAAEVIASIPATPGKAATTTSIPASATDTATIAAAITPAVTAQLQANGVTLPGAIATPIVHASLLDTFGANNRPWLIGGALALVALILLR